MSALPNLASGILVEQDDSDFAQTISDNLARMRRRADTSWETSNPDTLGLSLTWAANYPAATAPRVIVSGLLEAATLAVLYGESNSGKSTIALDIALALARGAHWRSRRTTHGVVLWLALESAAGLRRRVTAYRQHHGIGDTDLLFADITTDVRLLDVHDVERLVTTIEAAERIAARPVVLLVVDTVARAIAGGDENDGRDMGVLIKGCDLIRQRTGAAVLLIHHSGKDSTRGARGHSSLRAAVDTEIEVSGQANPRQAKVTKQRDLPNGDTFAFDLEPVEIGRDTDTGEAITACVVVHREDVAQSAARPRGKAQADLLRALRNRQAESKAPLIWTLEDMRKIGRDLGQHRNTARDAVDGLALTGFLTPSVGGHRLTEAKQ